MTNSKLKDDILKVLKDVISKDDDNGKIRDDLYFLFTLIAVENKADLLLQESDINNPDTLINRISENSIARQLSNLAKKIIDKHCEFKTFKDYHIQLNNVLNKIASMANSSKYPRPIQEHQK